MAKKKSTIRSRLGFTLVELIIVIVILGILAAVAVPAYSGYVKKAGQAADNQLLGAVNEAFAAACAEHGISPTDVSSATLTIDEKKITGVSSVTLGTGVSLLHAQKEGNFVAALTFGTPISASPTAILHASFLRYFSGNTDTELQYYDGLSFDRSSGTFKGDNLGNYAFQGKTLAIDSNNYQAVRASTFGDSDIISMDELMDEVNELTTLVGGGMADVFFSKLSKEDPEFVEGVFLPFLLESFDFTDEMAEISTLQSIPSSEQTEDQKNRLAELWAEYNSIGEKLQSEDVKANALVLYTALSASKIDTTSVLSTISKANTINGVLPKKANGSTDWSSGVGQLSLAYAMATAYSYQQGESIDYNSFNQLLSDDGFKDYLKTDQAQTDLNGYLACMDLLTTNIESGNIDAAHVLNNGFADSEIVSVLNSIFGQTE